MMTGRPRGQVDDNVFVISGDYTAEFLTIAADVLRTLPFVRQVGRSNDNPGDGKYAYGTIKSPDGTITPLYVLKCDSEAFGAFGFKAGDAEGLSTGLYLSDKALSRLSIHSTELDYGLLDGLPIADVVGVISDFVMNLENDFCSAVEVTESADFNRLIINTLHRDDDYSAILLKAFEDALLRTNATYSVPSDYGYLEHFHKKSIKQTESILSMLAIYTFFSLILGILGIVAMSTYYVSLHQRDSALRKVYGSSTNEEICLNMGRYLKTVLIAGVFGIISSVLINRIVLQSYNYRISSTFWIYLLVVVFITSISSISVYLQISRIVSQNPVLFLKAE